MCCYSTLFTSAYIQGRLLPHYRMTPPPNSKNTQANKEFLIAAPLLHPQYSATSCCDGATLLLPQYSATSWAGVYTQDVKCLHIIFLDWFTCIVQHIRQSCREWKSVCLPVCQWISLSFLSVLVQNQVTRLVMTTVGKKGLSAGVGINIKCICVCMCGCG